MGRVEILTGVERRRVWTDEDKLRILEEVGTSGSGVAEIARRHDILPQQIYTWRKKLARDIRSPSGSERDAVAGGADRTGCGKRTGSSRGGREGHSETAGKAVAHRDRLQRWPRPEGRCLDCAGNTEGADPVGGRGMIGPGANARVIPPAGRPTCAKGSTD
ncbi:transposase [Bradyrhizobium sp. BRP14]|nr:transposase [Bradyrhizobium sp. BRP14]